MSASGSPKVILFDIGGVVVSPSIDRDARHHEQTGSRASTAIKKANALRIKTR